MDQPVSQALARKWRPRDFESLVGQAHVVKALSHALENQRLHHAYLFTGTRGVGKTTIARILAKAVNCEQGISKTPCGVCNACREIAQGRFVDLLEVDAATNTRVDEMRALLENAMYAPTAGRYKVYVIDEVHMLSTSAFNAMLKTLEEPPGHVLFILATTDPQKIPPTVLSRCLQFNLRQLAPDQLAEHLGRILAAEGVPFEPAALRILGKAARGSVRDALSLTDQAIAYSAGQVAEEAVRTMLGAVDQQVVVQLLAALAQADGEGLLRLADALAEQSAPFGAILDELAAAAYRLSVAEVAGGLDTSDPDQAALAGLQGSLGAEDLQLIYQIATHARAELHLAPSEDIGFSMALVRMLAFKPGGKQPVGMPSQAPKPVAPSPAPPTIEKPAAIGSASMPVAPAAPAAPAAQLASPAAPASSPAAQANADLPSLPDAAQWPSVAQAVPAKGLTRQALVQTEWVSGLAEGNGLKITLRTSIKPYTEAGMVQRLEAALGSHFGQPVRLDVQYGQAQQTAHVVQTEHRKAALEQAKSALSEDPFLQDIQNLMDATVVSGSERHLGDTGPADV